jgi:glycosyltransferase involved in cell wall biosynthesis
VRILYLADIRFPLERANGIQTMETCHALASGGHDVTLFVRPDTQQPARDPFAYYELGPLDSLTIERAALAGPPGSRRAAYIAGALARSAGRTRQDLIFTRDLGLAALLVRLPRQARAPIVYEAHGLAADTAAALPALLTGAPAASAAKLKRLAARERRVWRQADGYVTITKGLAEELAHRFGPRSVVAVVADGTATDTTDNTIATDSTDNTDNTIATDNTDNTDHTIATDNTDNTDNTIATDSTDNTDNTIATDNTDNTERSRPLTVGYAGHLYPWKGVDLVIEVIAALPDTRGLIIGGHPGEADLARIQELARARGCAHRIVFTGLLPPRDARRRMRDADVLVLPNPASAISNRFTSPLKLFDYMAAGRPIVASDLPSIREVLANDDTAVLVEPGSVPALIAGVRRIRSDRALAARLARRALEEVRHYTWTERARRLDVLFRQVIG